MTPTTTATARSLNTVTTVTSTITIASVSGMRRMIFSVCQAKVPITTMNMTPTSAASGICSISEDAKRMKASRNKAAEIPERRVRPPDFTLIIDLADHRAAAHAAEKAGDDIGRALRHAFARRPAALAGDLADEVQRKQAFDQADGGQYQRKGER